MATKGNIRLLVFFAVLITGIIAALFQESFSGPTFRAADYENREECLANIPAEWAPGSIEHTGATEACAWEHGDPGSAP